MAGKIIVKNAVERKPGFLYYIDGEGNLCESKMARKAKKKDVAKKVVKKVVAKKTVNKKSTKKKK